MAAEDERRARAQQLRRAGHTLNEIKAELRVGSTKLTEWLAEVPVPPRQATPIAARAEGREEAVALRLRGMSYREIRDVVPVSKGTLSLWLRDVALTEQHRLRLAERKLAGSLAAAETLRARRIRRTELVQAEAAAEVDAISDRELFLLGVAAYWAEGSKAKPWAVSGRVVFTNSDPGMIRLFLAWLRVIGVPDADRQFRVAIHESADVDAATRFWSDVVGVGLSEFQPPSLKRHNPKTVRRNTGIAYVGCLVVRVRRSADLNRRIAGWWQAIEKCL